MCSSPLTEVYDPQAFIPHAASLRQTFVHCARFPDANSRRSLDHVSVPVWPIILSDRLWIVALVSRYLTNKLIHRGPIPQRRKALLRKPCGSLRPSGISSSFPLLFPPEGYVAHVLLTCSPLSLISFFPKVSFHQFSLDSHSLSTPPAFVLSQDQTLH